MADVLILGAGIVGCASAQRLAADGADVTVIEKNAFAEQAASRRAAGILGAQIESQPNEAMAALCIASRALYPGWAAELEASTGLDVELASIGVLRVAFSAVEQHELAAEVALQQRRGWHAALVDGGQARRVAPALSPEVVAAAHFPDDGVVDPPQLLAAARAAAEAAGARFVTHAGAVALDVRGGPTLTLASGAQHRAARVVIATGAWWSDVAAACGLAPDLVTPARGQMIELRLPRQLVDAVLESTHAYLSPRRDGRLLVGSTVEDVGFDEGVTAGAVGRLLSGAVRLVPELEAARVTDLWSGFRAKTPDDLPLFGLVRPGIVVASGHFRNGVLLAPISAAIVAALCSGREPPVDLRPFAPERFARGRDAEGSDAGGPG
jgi:glycine oxidase